MGAVIYQRILRRFGECVRRHDYVVTTHAEEEMAADDFSILDVECGVLTGSVLERQPDDKSGESKYRIRGNTTAGAEIELVAKLGPTGRMVIITVYAP